MKVKVCGMKDPENIQSLSKLDIDYMGFIFYENSARYTSDIPTVDFPETIQKVGVFVNATSDFIAEKVTLGLDAIQLHGLESPSFCEIIKKMNLPLFKAFGISESFKWESLAPYLDFVDYFLFDTKSNDYGGTGKVFDWSVLQKYSYPKPYFLSGGLSLDNIETSLKIQDERLVGLDLNSRFEIYPGLKDIEQVKKALKILKNE